jgi:RNA polymerase sigma factor (TIGR02999 family)
MAAPGEITRLLAEWSEGKPGAFDSLAPIVYDELRSLASSHIQRERSDHLLQTTALVHEAYLKLANWEHSGCDTRAQFFAVASKVMRHVLLDHARSRDRAKRGAGAIVVDLDEAAVISDDRAEELLTINAALDRLASFDPRKGQVFEMRYFGGMTVDEVATILKLSPVTVARDWRMAKLWLRHEMLQTSG